MLGNKAKSETVAQSIRVEIYNQTYNIRSDGDNDYILRLAEYVDGKMREISSGTLTVDSLKVAILAALHIADEYHQLKNKKKKSNIFQFILFLILLFSYRHAFGDEEILRAEKSSIKRNVDEGMKEKILKLENPSLAIVS